MFWVVVALAAGSGVATLERLGPPPPRPAEAAAVAPAAPVLPERSLVPGAPLRSNWNGRIADPDPALQEAAADLAPATLPRIAADGRMPMQVYARPADRNDPRPKIALLLSGYGLAEAESRAAVALPGAVDLAVSFYARQVDPLLDAARAGGHELLGSIPMESQGFPLNDAGYASLIVGGQPAVNGRNLRLALSHVPGAVGSTGASDGFRGERYSANPDAFGAVLAEVNKRGLIYIDPRPGAAPLAGVAGRSVDVVIDDPPARAEMEAKLNTLERVARANGSALGLAGPLRAATIERIASWAQELAGRGFVLVPVSALARPAAKP